MEESYEARTGMTEKEGRTWDAGPGVITGIAVSVCSAYLLMRYCLRWGGV